MKKISLIILLAVIGTAFSTGIIRGNVISTENGILSEANITVIGTSLGSATDEKGRFVIRGVPVGRYILRCSHIGFMDEFARGIEVRKDAVTDIEFVLEPTEYQLQAIEVDKKMDDFDSMIRTRDLSMSEMFVVQNVSPPALKGKIRVNTRVGFWERFIHFFRKK